MQAMKFRVTPETSPLVQKKLFEMGYSWSDGDHTIQYTDKSYLYAESSGDILYAETGSVAGNEDFFNEDINPEFDTFRFLNGYTKVDELKSTLESITNMVDLIQKELDHVRKVLDNTKQ